MDRGVVCVLVISLCQVDLPQSSSSVCFFQRYQMLLLSLQTMPVRRCISFSFVIPISVCTGKTQPRLETHECGGVGRKQRKHPAEIIPLEANTYYYVLFVAVLGYAASCDIVIYVSCSVIQQWMSNALVQHCILGCLRSIVFGLKLGRSNISHMAFYLCPACMYMSSFIGGLISVG